MSPFRGALIRLAAAAALVAAFPSAGWAELPVRTVNTGTVGEISQLSGDRVVHRQSGFAFPSKLADMPASEVVVYGPGDVSVEYGRKGRFSDAAWLTFYVYPALGEVSPNADIVEQIIVDQWAGKRMSGAPAAPQAIADGRSGWFDAKRDGTEYLTGYVLVQRGAWHLKARFSVSKQAGAEGIKELVSALEAAPWTWLPTS